MDIKNKLILEFEKEDRLYRLEMPHGAPLGEAYEAAGCFLAKFVALINEHEKNREKEKENDEIGDEPSV